MTDFTLSHIAHWVKKGGLAVLDQGLFSGANFLVNILLARWLLPEQYGAFAVAYSIFMLLASFHTAMLTEPMLIFGARKYAENFRKYLAILTYGHWTITGMFAILLGVVTALFFWWFDSVPMTQSIGGFAIALPFILLLQLGRRAFYVEMRLKLAALGSGAYLMLVLVGIFGAYWMNLLSSLSAIVVMGIAGLGSSLLLVFFLQPEWRLSNENPTIGMILVDHWSYGRWRSLIVVIHWLSGQILIILVPIFLGLYSAAVVAAMLNLFRPLNSLMRSMNSLMLSSFSELLSERIDWNLVKQRLWIFLLLIPGGFLIYGICMTAFADLVIYGLYGGNFGEYSNLVALFASAYTATAVIQVFTALFKASGHIRSVAFIWAIPAILMSVMTIPVMLVWGLVGAILVNLLSYIVAAGVAFITYKRVEGSLV